jgi:hypothetical protein
MFALVLSQTVNAGTNVSIYVANVSAYASISVNKCINKCIKSYFCESKVLFSAITLSKILFSQKRSYAFVVAYVCICCGISFMCYEKIRSNKSTSVEPAPYI